MRLASLGSGSKGNSTLVQCGDTTLLIDCGFSLAEFGRRSERLGLDGKAISAILVTHEHSDHGAGVKRLAKRYGMPVYATVGTARALELDDFEAISGEQQLSIGALGVQVVTVPHDAAEPVQFVFTGSDDMRRFGLLTDTGHVTRHMQEVYSDLHGLLLEFNYDATMLQNGPYPPSLKQRISGGFGHLSNDQSMALLQAIDSNRLDCLIAAHLSEKNNTPQIVSNLLQAADLPLTPVLACQQQGFSWMEV